MDLSGNPEEAVRIAREVYPIAKAFRFDNLADTASSYIEGKPYYKKMAEDVRARQPYDEDESIASLSDDDLHSLAEHIREASELPPDRLPHLLQECESWRFIARERLHWCKHIELLDDIVHESHPATHFATDPDRYSECDKHGHRSRFGNPDFNLVIKAFKTAYCQGCSDREAKQRG
jgi:hypothetical protein